MSESLFRSGDFFFFKKRVSKNTDIYVINNLSGSILIWHVLVIIKTFDAFTHCKARCLDEKRETTLCFELAVPFIYIALPLLSRRLLLLMHICNIFTWLNQTSPIVTTRTQFCLVNLSPNIGICIIFAAEQFGSVSSKTTTLGWRFFSQLINWIEENLGKQQWTN